MAKVSQHDQRRINSLLQTESHWLQRVLFGLNKAEEARQKVAELKGQRVDPIDVKVKKGTVSLDSLKDALTLRAEALIEALNEERRVVRKPPSPPARKARTAS